MHEFEGALYVYIHHGALLDGALSAYIRFVTLMEQYVFTCMM